VDALPSEGKVVIAVQTMFEAMTHGVLGLVVMLLLLVIWMALLNWVMGKVDAFRDKKRKIQPEVKEKKKRPSPY
jgi:uncharacterized membrane protein